MGVKAFSRSPSPIVPQCDFRITQEVLGTLLADVTKRKVAVSKSDAITVISQENPYIGKLSEALQAQIHTMLPGSTVFMFTPSEKEPAPNCQVVFCGWRGKNSVRCFGSRCERSHALMLLGEDLKDINLRVEAEKKLKQIARDQARQDGEEPLAAETDEEKGCNDEKDECNDECVGVKDKCIDVEEGCPIEKCSDVKEKCSDDNVDIKEVCPKNDGNSDVKEEGDNVDMKEVCPKNDVKEESSDDMKEVHPKDKDSDVSTKD